MSFPGIRERVTFRTSFLYVILSVMPVGAHEARGGRFSLEVPDAWMEVDLAGERPTGPLPEASGFLSAWVKKEGDFQACMTLRVGPYYTEASAGRIPLGKREIEQAMLARPGMEGFQVRDLRLVTLNGAPAYRIRASVEAKGAWIEELQYLISGKETFLLTFSCQRESFEEEEEGFEKIARSIELADRSAIITQMPAELCCCLLGVLAGLGAAVRSARTSPVMSGLKRWVGSSRLRTLQFYCNELTS